MSIEDKLYPLLKFYFASPRWVKRSIGQMYSLMPVSLRCGNGYDDFLNEALQRNERDVTRLRDEKLAATLRSALQSVPAYEKYRFLLKHLGSPLDVLRELPPISKEDIKRDLPGFVAAGMPANLRLHTATGGSTSTPMEFYLHKGVTRTKEYAFMEAFHRRAGLTEQDVILALRGRTVPGATRPRNAASLSMYEPIKRQLILSSDHLDRRYMPEYMKAIRAWKPTYIQAYPSALYLLARWLKDNPAPDITDRIKGIMLYSENVLDYHMTLLKEVFPCPVLRHYGHSERILMAASLPDDPRYFFWPQYGHFELVDDDGTPITTPGVLGEIVGTSFDNHVMPFVRYRTGDLGMLSDRGHPLLPGYPAMEKIEGRRQEFLVCRDRRLIPVCAMGAAHSSDLSVVDSMQFEQDRPGHILIKVVAPKPLTDDARARIVHAMEAKTQGGCTAEIVEVKAIPRTKRGKHQLLVQHLDLSDYIGVPA